jgi:hypothetical protein
MTEKAFVTGGAGFIGSHVDELIARGHEVIVLDDLSGGFQENDQSKRRTVLVVNETARAKDALPPQTPIHFSIGQYPLLDQQPTYRVIKQFGALKLYAYTPKATGPFDRLRPGGPSRFQVKKRASPPPAHI